MQIVTKSGSNFAPTFVDNYILSGITCNEFCLIHNISVTKKIINLCISYTITTWLRNLNIGFTLNNSLFGSVKLTKNTDPDYYEYSKYAMGFDSQWDFVYTDGSMGRNATELLMLHKNIN